MMTQIERFSTTTRMSKIVRHAGILYLCGQTAKGAATPDIKQQTRETLTRIDGLLAEGGSSRAALLSVLIHLRDMRDFAAMNEIWEAWLPDGAAPARTTVQASMASEETLVEMTVTAAVVTESGV